MAFFEARAVVTSGQGTLLIFQLLPLVPLHQFSGYNLLSGKVVLTDLVGIRPPMRSALPLGGVSL